MDCPEFSFPKPFNEGLTSRLVVEPCEKLVSFLQSISRRENMVLVNLARGEQNQKTVSESLRATSGELVVVGSSVNLRLSGLGFGI